LPPRIFATSLSAYPWATSHLAAFGIASAGLSMPSTKATGVYFTPCWIREIGSAAANALPDRPRVWFSDARAAQTTEAPRAPAA
jgi:hypothetical protein